MQNRSNRFGFAVFSWKGRSSQKSEVGTQKSEVGTRKSEVGTRKSEVGTRKSEVALLGRRKFHIHFRFALRAACTNKIKK
jgi:hypothetical protein